MDCVEHLFRTSVLKCPGCGERLLLAGELANCSTCSSTWPFVDGVIEFGGVDPRRQPLSTTQRRELLEITTRDGWQVAFHDHLRALAPRVYRQATDTHQANLAFLLPLTRSSRVLDLNCGLGAAVLSLADTCEMVVATDPCAVTARLMKLRARQTSRDNVVVLQLGFDQPPPFANASFDAVLLIDVLCWVPGNAERRALLERARSVLRPGGTLLIADGNRLGPDRLIRRGRRHAALATRRGYRRLLHEAGYTVEQTYAPLPSHLEPFFLVPIGARGPLSYFLREILGVQDFGAQLEQRGLRPLYRIARTAVRTMPPSWITTVAAMFVPSLAIVART